MRASLTTFFTGFFFKPDHGLTATPADFGLQSEEIRFRSKTGARLFGYFLRPEGAPKGTVVHCHGNAGNLSVHLEFVVFLVRAGYNVFAFDYGGYGLSEGYPSPESVIVDTLAAIDTVRARGDVDPARIALFGQSLGGTAASGAAKLDGGVRCLILDSTFATYRAMAWRTLLGRTLFFLTPFVIPDVGPLHDLKEIKGRPVLFVHGLADRMVPPSFSRRLHAAAAEPKALALIEGRRHLCGEGTDAPYEAAILAFLARCL